MSAAYISSVFFSGSPRNEAGPVTDNTAPILTSARTSAPTMTVAKPNPAATSRPRVVPAIVSSRIAVPTYANGITVLDGAQSRASAAKRLRHRASAVRTAGALQHGRSANVVRSARDELLAAVDVVRRASERRVAHDVNG